MPTPKSKHGGLRPKAGRPPGEGSVTVRISKAAYDRFSALAKKQDATVREVIEVVSRRPQIMGYDETVADDAEDN